MLSDPKGRVLDLESEVMGGPGSILNVSLDFLFSRGKASDVDVGIIAILVHFE